jgi:hypothetical protein
MTDKVYIFGVKVNTIHSQIIPVKCGHDLFSASVSHDILQAAISQFQVSTLFFGVCFDTDEARMNDLSVNSNPCLEDPSLEFGPSVNSNPRLEDLLV